MQTLNFKRVKQAREILDLEQEDIARAINLPVTAISKIENGKQKLPAALLTFFYSNNISSDWILSGQGQMYLNRNDYTGIHNTNTAKGEKAVNKTAGSDSASERVNFYKNELDKKEKEVDALKAEIRECRQELKEERQKYYDLLLKIANH